VGRSSRGHARTPHPHPNWLRKESGGLTFTYQVLHACSRGAYSQYHPLHSVTHRHHKKFTRALGHLYMNGAIEKDVEGFWRTTPLAEAVMLVVRDHPSPRTALMLLGVNANDILPPEVAHDDAQVCSVPSE